MEKTRKIVLYGSDLVVSTIGANLQGLTGFEMVQIDPLLPDALPKLAAALPDVILFDLAGVQPDFTIVNMIMKNPGLLLIGVDLDTGKMLVMSTKESRLLTTDDLLAMIGTGKPHG